MRTMVVLAFVFLIGAVGVSVATAKLLDQHIGLSQSQPLEKRDLAPSKPKKAEPKAKRQEPKKSKRTKRRGPDRAEANPVAPVNSPSRDVTTEQSQRPAQNQMHEQEESGRQEEEEEESGSEEYDD